MLFDLIFYLVNGEFVYNLLDPTSTEPYVLVLVAIGCYIAMGLLSYAIIELKKFADRHIK